MTSTNIYTDQDDLYEFPEDLFFDCAANNFAVEMKRVFPGLAQQFLYFNWLTCFGSMISHRVKLNSVLNISPRLFLLNLGKSGTGLKSEAAKQTIQGVFKHIEGFRYSTGCGSGEGLASYFSEAPNLLLFSDELRRVLNKGANVGNTILPVISTLADSTEYNNRLAKEKIAIENAHLSWMTMCPTSAFENSWKSAFSDIGLDNRLFIVPGAGVRCGIPEAVEIDPEIIEIAKDIYKWVVTPKPGEPAMPDGRRLISFTQEAKEIHNLWDTSLIDSEFNSRINTYAIRFYMLYACAMKSSDITPEIVRSGIKLMAWQLGVRETFFPTETKNTVALFQEKIRKFFEKRIQKGVEPVEYKSRILDNMSREEKENSTKTFEEAIHFLEVSGRVRVEGNRVFWLESEGE
jgi:hypothetical protein